MPGCQLTLDVPLTGIEKEAFTQQSVLRYLMKIALLLVLPLIFPLLSLATPDADTIKEIEAITWYTEEFPPYNYKDNDGLATGISVDVLVEMFKRLGVNKTRKDFKILPWARSYKYLQTQPGTALFSTTYTTERLELITFVGPILPSRVSVIAAKSKNLTISSADELDSLVVGTIRDAVGEQLARKWGVKESAFNKQNKVANLIRLLSIGRLDVIVYNENVAKYLFKEAGLDPNDYESVYVLDIGQLGYAFHKSTKPSVLESLRKTLEQMRIEGVLGDINNKYLK